MASLLGGHLFFLPDCTSWKVCILPKCNPFALHPGDDERRIRGWQPKCRPSNNQSHNRQSGSCGRQAVPIVSGCQPETAVSRIKGGVFLFREEMNREEQETSAGESAKEASRGGA